MKSRTILGLVFSALVLLGAGVLLARDWQAVPDLNINEIGDFAAGIGAILAFIWLVIGYWQQGDELRENTQALASHLDELKTSAEATAALAIAAERQATAANEQAEAAKRLAQLTQSSLRKEEERGNATREQVTATKNLSMTLNRVESALLHIGSRLKQ